MSGGGKPVVLITGCTGYLGAWVTKTAVESGKYTVRGTTRNVNGKRATKLKAMFPDLQLVACELLHDDGWKQAFDGVSCLLHTASPFNSDPKFDYVTPALEGTKRVLKFAKEAGVKKIVVTSSMLCVTGGRSDLSEKPVTGEQWAKMEKNPISYHNSKMIAEEYVWQWSKENPDVQLNTVCPAFIVGPALLGTAGGSLDYWKMFVSSSFAAPIHFIWVDVRDVAELHIAFLEDTKENGRRLASKVEYILDVMGPVGEEFLPMGYTVPTSTIPHCLITTISICLSCCNPLETFMPYMKEFTIANEEEESKLKSGKWRNIGEACVEMWHGFIQNGEMPKLAGYKEKSM